jgi:circadian clock protein KaiB
VTQASKNTYLLRLFVSGQTPTSQQAIRTLESICSEALDGRYQLEVIDVLDEPDAADEAEIIITPTLLRQLPIPIRRIIGNLADKESVLLKLELVPGEEQPPTPQKR